MLNQYPYLFLLSHPRRRSLYSSIESECRPAGYLDLSRCGTASGRLRGPIRQCGRTLGLCAASHRDSRSSCAVATHGTYSKDRQSAPPYPLPRTASTRSARGRPVTPQPLLIATCFVQLGAPLGLNAGLFRVGSQGTDGRRRENRLSQNTHSTGFVGTGWPVLRRREPATATECSSRVCLF